MQRGRVVGRLGVASIVCVCVSISLAVSAFGLAGANPATASTATQFGGTWNVTDTCTSSNCAGRVFTATFQINQCPGSASFTGVATGGGYVEQLVGSANSGSATFTESIPGYIAKFQVAISSDGQSFTGSYTDNQDGTGTTVGKRTAGGSSRDAGPLVRDAAFSCSRETTTDVTCKYPSHLGPGAAVGTCYVTVADRGPPPQAHPTGSVEVSSRPAGTSVLFGVPLGEEAGANGCKLVDPPGEAPNASECSFVVAGTDRFHGGHFGVNAAYIPGSSVFVPSKATAGFDWPHVPLQTKLVTVNIVYRDRVDRAEVIARGGTKFRFCDDEKIAIEPYVTGLGGTLHQYQFHVYSHNEPNGHNHCETFRLPHVTRVTVFKYFAGNQNVFGFYGYGILVP